MRRIKVLDLGGQSDVVEVKTNHTKPMSPTVRTLQDDLLMALLPPEAYDRWAEDKDEDSTPVPTWIDRDGEQRE